jgi:hypothetical protein
MAPSRPHVRSSSRSAGCDSCSPTPRCSAGPLPSVADSGDRLSGSLRLAVLRRAIQRRRRALWSSPAGRSGRGGQRAQQHADCGAPRYHRAHGGVPQGAVAQATGHAIHRGNHRSPAARGLRGARYRRSGRVTSGVLRRGREDVQRHPQPHWLPGQQGLGGSR